MRYVPGVTAGSSATASALVARWLRRCSTNTMVSMRQCSSSRGTRWVRTSWVAFRRRRSQSGRRASSMLGHRGRLESRSCSLGVALALGISPLLVGWGGCTVASPDLSDGRLPASGGGRLLALVTCLGHRRASWWGVARGPCWGVWGSAPGKIWVTWGVARIELFIHSTAL